jgi:hypothetical protein
MKILEVLNSTRKIIKQLNNLYIAYTLDNSKYSDLVMMINSVNQTNDNDLIREINIINNKLYTDIMSTLKAGF